MKIKLGIMISLVVYVSFLYYVYAEQYHYAYEVYPGTFQPGDYMMPGNLAINLTGRSGVAGRDAINIFVDGLQGYGVILVDRPTLHIWNSVSDIAANLVVNNLTSRDRIYNDIGNIWIDDTAYISGRLGIGISAPVYTLDVNGKIATPYTKSEWTGQYPGDWLADLTKDGTINSQDSILAARKFGCNKTQTGCPDVDPPFGECDCWDDIVGIDNLGSEIYTYDCDISSSAAVGVPDNKIDIADIAYITERFKDPINTVITPEIEKVGDLDRDGRIDSREVYYVASSFGCIDTLNCWDDIIGVTIHGNYIYKSDCDISSLTVGVPDGEVDIADVTYMAQNYDPHIMLISMGYKGYPAAIFRGSIGVEGDLQISDGYLQIFNVSAAAPLPGDCNSDGERGRVAIDPTNNRLYICMGATRQWDWIALND